MVGGIVLFICGGLFGCSNEDGVVGERGHVPEPSPASVEVSVPVSTSESSPFASPVFRRGLEAWRRPHSIGACANCHTPDAYDLAFFNYSDSVILRRAMGQQASVDDAKAIVELVHYLRDRHKIRPVDVTKYDFLQPGGQVVPGARMIDRDMNFYLLLRQRGLRVAQKERIVTLEEAIKARNEILALDLRTVPIGLRVNAWTSDGFRGDQFFTLQKWIPEIPRHPKPGSEEEWYNLQNQYIENPTPRTLWAYVDRTEELTDHLNLIDATAMGGAERVGAWLKHYRAVQIGGQIMRTNDTRFPDAYTLSDQEILSLSQNQSKDHANLVHSRIDSLWGSGSPERGARGWYETNGAPEFLDVKLRQGNYRLDANLNQCVWNWLGMVYDGTLQFSAASNRAEYFFELCFKGTGLLAGQEGVPPGASSDVFSYHASFMNLYLWTYAAYGNDNRFHGSINPQRTNFEYWTDSINARYLGTIPTMPRISPPGYFDHLRVFYSNIARIKIFSLMEMVRNHGVNTNDRDAIQELMANVERIREWDPPETLQPVSAAIGEIFAPHVKTYGEGGDYKDFEQALGWPDFNRHSLYQPIVHIPVSRLESKPLIIPESSYATAPDGPFGPVYANKCAGCHGENAEGRIDKNHPEIIYPNITNVPLDRLRAVVRAGLPAPLVSMPNFTEQEVTDTDLEHMAAAFEGQGK